MTPLEMAKWLRAFPKRLAAEVSKAEAETLKEAKAELVRRSKGTLTKKQLRKLKNPFAKRHPQPSADPTILNEQSGRTGRSWRVLRVRRKPTGTSGSVINNAPQSEYWEGTDKMVARKIGDPVYRKIRRNRAIRIRAAVKRATQRP